MISGFGFPESQTSSGALVTVKVIMMNLPLKIFPFLLSVAVARDCSSGGRKKFNILISKSRKIFREMYPGLLLPAVQQGQRVSRSQSNYNVTAVLNDYHLIPGTASHYNLLSDLLSFLSDKYQEISSNLDSQICEETPGREEKVCCRLNQVTSVSLVFLLNSFSLQYLLQCLTWLSHLACILSNSVISEKDQRRKTSR